MLRLSLLLSALFVVALTLPAVPLEQDAVVAPAKKNFDPEKDDAVPADRYLTYEEMSTWLQGVARRYPKMAKLTSIGNSVQGRDLWLLELSHSIGRGQRDLLMPMVKLVGNIHGNEVVGRQLLLQTISHLIQRDETDRRVNRLLNTTDIYFLPSMNPDGFVKAQEGDCWGGGPESGRLNANDKDLNRDFPDQFRAEDKVLKTRTELTASRQPETQALINLIVENPFVLSASLHGGAVVASYPFDNSEDHQHSGYYSAAPDDKVFRQLSQDYADRHPTMKKADVCGGGFKDGITNGAYWYDLMGGMQDFNYMRSNAFEITLELSCCKYAPGKDLPAEWENNRKPILNFLASTHRGVRGLVVDQVTKEPISHATIIVDGISKNITSTDRGEYWRLLVPGTYTLQAFADGYAPGDKKDVIITNLFTEQMNFELTRLATPGKVTTRLICD